MGDLRTLDDVPLDGRRVLVRVDFNVTVGADNTVDEFEDYRIESALETINELRQRRCKILLLTHRGEPDKNPQDADLSAIHYRLQELLGEEVKQTTHLYGAEVDTVTNSLEPGGVLLLPNVRTDSREESDNQKFAQELASLADIYINEGFSVSHRNHVSVAAVASLLPAAAGRRTELEYEVLKKLRDTPEHPYVAIVSGAKITTKVGMLYDLLTKVEYICLGGQLANVFLAAQGKYQTDQYPVDEIAVAKSLLERDSQKFIIPVDVVLGSKDGLGAVTTVDVEAIPPNTPGLWDIGPKSVAAILERCRSAATIMWNGPVGMCEVEAYSSGTSVLAQGLATLPAYRVIGGGDTVNALEKLKLKDKFNHVSVGGGAMIAFMEGQRMPGLEPLRKN